MKCRVRAIITRGDELLLVRHKRPSGEPYNTWVLPGGGIDDGEMLLDAMRREMIEETGIAPVIGKLLFVHQFKYEGVFQGPEFFFHVENTEDYEHIDLSKTSHGQLEIAEIGFYDPRTLGVVLPEFLKEIGHITVDGPTQLVIQTEENT